MAEIQDVLDLETLTTPTADKGTSTGQMASTEFVSRATKIAIDKIVASVAAVAAIFSDTTMFRDRCSHLTWEREVYREGKYLGRGTTAERDLVTVQQGDIWDNTTTGQWEKYIVDHTNWLKFSANGWQATDRGCTRKIPANVFAYAETNKVTFIDPSNPDTPMWMVFNIDRVCGSLSYEQGQFCVGGTGIGLLIIDFLKPLLTRVLASGTYTQEFVNTIAAANFTLLNSTALVSSVVNQVAMTVLPDAPVNPETGVQVPAKVVPTAGGGSWIKDDGTVIDATGAINLVDADINTDGMTVWAAADKLYIFDEIPTGDIALTAADYIFDTAGTSGPHVHGVIASVSLNGSDLIVGTDEGVVLIKYNPNSPADSMVAYQDTKQPPVWQVGDTKLACLASTDDTDLVGVELAPDLTTYADQAAAEADGWVFTASGSFDAANDEIDHASGTAEVFATYSDIVVPGVSYVIEYTVANYTGSGSIRVRLGSAYNITVDADGRYTDTIIANGTDLGLWAVNTATDFSIKDITIRLADADRSVNDKGLATHGTVPRNPVAPGAELMGYGPFSLNNFFEQPYNSDLDIGTGDFHMLIHAVTNTTANQLMVDRADAAYTGGRFALGFVSSKVYISASATSGGIVTTVDAPSDRNFYAVIRKDGMIYLYLNKVLVYSVANTEDISNVSALLKVGLGQDLALPWLGTLSLLRIAKEALSQEQLEYIYNWEKRFFQEDSKCTLAGTSNAVITHAYDQVTKELGIETSYGLSKTHDGLLISEEATTVGTPTCIAMHDGNVAQGGSTAIKLYSPAENLRTELLRADAQIAYFNEKPEAFPFLGDSVETDFILPFGWKPTELVYRDGSLVLKGAANAYIKYDDGFLEGARFNVAPGAIDVVIFAVRNGR